MATYSREYDASGEMGSIVFHDHDKDAETLLHSDLKCPMPSGLTFTRKDGSQVTVTSRVVLEGNWAMVKAA